MGVVRTLLVLLFSASALADNHTWDFSSGCLMVWPTDASKVAAAVGNYLKFETVREVCDGKNKVYIFSLDKTSSCRTKEENPSDEAKNELASWPVQLNLALPQLGDTASRIHKFCKVKDESRIGRFKSAKVPKDLRAKILDGVDHQLRDKILKSKESWTRFEASDGRVYAFIPWPYTGYSETSDDETVVFEIFGVKGFLAKKDLEFTEVRRFGSIPLNIVEIDGTIMAEFEETYEESTASIISPLHKDLGKKDCLKYRTNEEIDLRKIPSKKSKVVGKMKKNSIFCVENRSVPESKWFEVSDEKSRSVLGWLKNENLKGLPSKD